jgi:methylase of polypeptide subunit release factors
LEESETAIDKTSDIISGVYEGGNKVWECSVDLAVLLLQKKYQLPNPATGRVIELGCGHGFPGIAALQLGYQHVFFSDLNSEVIDGVTWPNVYLNCQSAIPRVSCYSGDWEALSTHLLR